MTDFINDDAVNNITYMNYFNALTNGEINLDTDANSVNVMNACLARWGAGTALQVGSTTTANRPIGVRCFPNTPQEMKTDRAASLTNYRMTISPISSGLTGNTASAKLNSNTLITTAITGVNLVVPASINAVINSYEYAIITNQNISVAGFASNGASLDTTTRRFVSGGWLSDTPFSGGTAIRSLYTMLIASGEIEAAFRVSAENQTTVQTLLTSGDAQYPISCASNTGDGTTPGADLWCTDLWLRDSPSGYAVGRIPHVLLAKGAGFTLGDLYYNPTVIDGITDQKIWLCCANYGSDKLLQRVWTEGIS